MKKKIRARTYTRDFIESTLNLVETQKKSVQQVADDLGIPVSTINTWSRKFNTGIWKFDSNSKTLINKDIV